MFYLMAYTLQHLNRDFEAWHSHIKGLIEILKLQNQQRNADNPTSAEVGFLNLNTLVRQSLAWYEYMLIKTLSKH